MTKTIPHGTRCACRGQCLTHDGQCERAHRRYSQGEDGKLYEYALQMTKQGPFCRRCWAIVGPKRAGRKTDDAAQGQLFGEKP